MTQNASRQSQQPSQQQSQQPSQSSQARPVDAPDAPPAPHTYDYPRPAVTVDIILFTFRDSRLQVLLIQRKHAPFADKWALPGGFVRMDESLEAAALRELGEETGVRDVYLEQLYTFGDPRRDPRGRVITVSYFALLSADQVIGMEQRGQIQGNDDASAASWWDIYDLPELAFDHRPILDYALQRLRWKLEWTALGFLLLPEAFTLSELQQAYETILHEALDKRNFRRKILASGLLEPTGAFREGDHRPAKLYQFTAQSIEVEQGRRRFP